MVSIIVPVYNTEKYLKDCLESLVKQTYDKIEIILVDDGSTDSSGKICDKWAKIDDRIHVYHKKNEGVSRARNYGIQRAKGEKLVFIDSDDMLTLNAIECMVEVLLKQNVELVACQYQSDKYNKKVEKETLKIEKVSRQSYLEELMIPNKNIAAFVYNRLYLKRIILENDIRFNENVKVCEDTLFNYEYANAINSIAFINNPLYYYRINSDSTMFQKKMNPGKLTANIVFDKILKETVNDDEKKIISIGCIAYNVILLMQMYKYKWKDRDDYVIIKNHLKLYPIEFMKSRIRLKYKIGYLILRIMPKPRG